MQDSVDSKVCRITKYGSFSPADFNRISCSNCYKLLVFVISETRLAFNTTLDGYLTSNDLNRTLDPTKSADRSVILNSLNELQAEKWQECCSQAEVCCTDVMVKDRIKSLGNFSLHLLVF